jgi:hypothetical protein
MTSTPPPSSGGSSYGTAWSFSAERGVSGSPGSPRRRSGPTGPELDPRSNRLLKIAGLLAAALIAVVVNAALHSDGNPLNPVAEAAQRTERAPGMKIAFEFTYGSSQLASPLVGHGSGAYNTRSGRTRIDFSMPIPGHPTLTMHGVGDERTVFLSSPLLAPTLPPGKSWFAMQPLLGHSAETAFGNSGDAKSSLDMLRAAGDSVDEKGQMKIRGHLTTLYSGTIDLGSVTETLEERGEKKLAHQFEQIAKRSPAAIPFEVWVDENGLARRLRLVQQLPSASGQPALTMDMKMEFFDFRARPKIELPPRRKVFDMTPMLRAELGLLNGSAFAGLTRPSGRAPMPAAAFRRQGNAICGDVLARGKAMVREAKAFAQRLGGLGGSPAAAMRRAQRYTRAFYRPAWALEVKALRRLGHLSPPAEDARAYAELMRDGAVEAETRLAEIVAIEAGNMPLARHVTDRLQAHRSGDERLARNLGWTACVDHDRNSGHSEASVE